MTDIFLDIKKALDIVVVASDFGLNLNKHNKALSPFSNEKTPSFIIFPETQSFYCYSTNQGGTVIDLVMKLTGLSLIETAKHLNDKYNLNIDLSKHEDSVEIMQRQAEREKREVLKAARCIVFKYVSKAFRNIENIIEETRPKCIYEKPTYEFFKLLTLRDKLQYYCDTLNFGTDEEVYIFINERGKEVKSIYERFRIAV